MRALSWILLALVGTMAFATAATAQDVAVRVLEDASGDAKMLGPGGTDLPYPEERMAVIDLVAVDLTETGDGFRFDILMAGGIAEPAVPFSDGVYAYVTFVHNQVAFAIYVAYFDNGPFGSWSYSYLGVDLSGAGEAFEPVANLDASFDRASGAWSVQVPRLLMADRDGAMPSLGRSLTDFAAVSEGVDFGFIYINGEAVAQVAKATDEATSDAQYAVRIGVEQTGHARLVSERPYRYSNGEAGTFLFEVTARNVGVESDTFRLTAAEIPSGWQVTLPRDLVHLDAGDDVVIPVIVSMPFDHAHGRVTSFLLEMTSATDAQSVGRILMGFLYPDPPQPGGHHPNLVVHSMDVDPFTGLLSEVFPQTFGRLYMNTAVDDPLDAAVDVPGLLAGWSDDLTSSTFQWIVPLAPGLGMGMDFDLEALGTASISFTSDLPAPGAVLEGALYVMEGYHWYSIPEDMPAVAVLESTEPKEMAAGGQVTFDTVIRPLQAGDHIPHEPENNLFLALNLTIGRTATFTGAEAPSLRPGATLKLPLVDYTDKVSAVFSSMSSLALVAENGQERTVPPGATALFDLRLFAPEEGAFTLSALGSYADWVVYPDGNRVDVGASREARVSIGVAVPLNATDVPLADILLQAGAVDDASQQGLVLLRVRVDPQATVDGVTAVESVSERTKKAVSPVWLGGVALALALARRTRRTAAILE